MEFRIADSFTASLGRLTAAEQQAVKNTAFDLQVHHANPGARLHKLTGTRDGNFWSASADLDIRLILHRTQGSTLLCYVDHHDAAYAWAERRKLETHPTTGAAQLVEIRETIQEIFIPVYVHQPTPMPALRKPRPFEQISDSDLLSYGVPAEWLNDVKSATEDAFFELAEHLPAEAAEALLELAAGGKPRPRPVLPPADSFEHPDSLRRFRVIGDLDELARALEYPWDRWMVFLHPAQQELVERHFAGPARISGTAGTGKTIVALHRAVQLARANPDCRVLLTTFSDTLAGSLQAKLSRLLASEPRIAERIDVESLDTLAQRLCARTLGSCAIAQSNEVREIIKHAAGESPGHKFTLPFLVSEWEGIVDAWQLDSWEAYRDVARLGRKIRLPESQRAVLWEIFTRVRAELAERKLITPAQMYTQLASHYAERGRSPYDFIVVDEAQDVGVAQLRFIASLGSGRPDSLFFAGDLGQRIFQLPFSWKSLGVDIRGRSGTLRTNYRTSHQIRSQADRLLGKEVADVDGNVEDRRGTVSVFNGPKPVIVTPASSDEETTVVGEWLAQRSAEGVKPEEIGLIVRSEAEVPRAVAAAKRAGLPVQVLDGKSWNPREQVSVCTMHLSKGLEFRAVAVMACDEEVLPLQERIETAAEESDLEEVYHTERHLLYVACTRARDHLLVSGVKPASEFLADLSL